MPQLPLLFELIYGFTITFQVHAVRESLSVPVSNNYLDLASESDYCTRHEFVVEAVSNISHELRRQNSSAISGYFVSGEFSI